MATITTPAVERPDAAPTGPRPNRPHGVSGLSLAIAAAAALGGFALGTFTAPVPEAPAPVSTLGVPTNPDAAEAWLTPGSSVPQGLPRVNYQPPAPTVPTNPDAAERWLTTQGTAQVGLPTTPDGAERWVAR
jgi:hypothetical protein